MFAGASPVNSDKAQIGLAQAAANPKSLYFARFLGVDWSDTVEVSGSNTDVPTTPLQVRLHRLLRFTGVSTATSSFVLE
jgi:hypothetical protein